jgi:hypothetical protein
LGNKTSGDGSQREDVVNHPSHYTQGKYEVIDILEDWDLDFCRANAVKYIARAKHKDPTKEQQDIEKAIWYLARSIRKTAKLSDLIPPTIEIKNQAYSES